MKLPSDWTVILLAFVGAVITRELCVYLGIKPLRRDEAVLTVIVFLILLITFRSLWHRAKFWLVLAGVFLVHCGILWVVLDVVLGARYRITIVPMLVIGVGEASTLAYFLGLLQYYDNQSRGLAHPFGQEKP